MANDDDEVAEINDLLEEVNRNVFFFRPTPTNFDPETSEAGLLDTYGIPPRPNPSTERGRYEFWKKMFSGSWQFVGEPSFTRRPRLRHRITDTQPPVIPSRRHERSLNWSGGYVTANQGRTFTEVHGEFQVPNVSPPIADGDNTPPGDYRSSTWVGLDGQKRFLHSSLPQIGTAQEVTVVNGQAQQPDFSTWWQWWIRGKKNNHPVPLPLNVKPGDLVLCSLFVREPQVANNPQIVKFIIRNLSTREAFLTFEYPAPLSPSGVQLKISGATAEWVVERPTETIPNGRLYELANYNTVVFSNCHAVSASPRLGKHTQTVDVCKLIKMQVVREHPHRTRRISSAERPGDQEIATFYR